MRCAACDRVMSPFEASLRTPETGQFADLCNICYRISFDLAEDEEADDIAYIFFERNSYEQDG